MNDIKFGKSKRCLNCNTIVVSDHCIACGLNIDEQEKET